MGFFGAKLAVTPRTKRIILGDVSQYSNSVIPFTNYDPFLYDTIQSNTTTSISFSSQIGSQLNSNSAYVIELSNGRYFFVDTSSTISSANSTATILNNLGFPLILSGENFSGINATIRRCISFYDLINGGLVVSGAFKSGASGVGDLFYTYTESGPAYTMIYRTSTTWRNLSNITQNNYPVSAFVLFQRTASATGGTLIIEVPMSNII